MYQKQIQEIETHFSTSLELGLSSEVIAQHLGQYGPNALPEQKPTSVFTIFFRQFLSPLMFVLLFAAIASFFIGEINDAILIAIAAFINVFIGFFQEWKAQRAAIALKSYEVPKATVKRDGTIQIISAKDLVPGDFIFLPAGARVPADVRLSYVNDFKVEEAILTGESEPILKRTEAVAENVPLGDRTSMAYAGTYVVNGKAEGIVVATGQHTALGDIARLVAHTEEEATPLQQQIKKFSWFLGAMMGVIMIIISILGIAKGFSFHKIFTLAIALAVAAIPEGLLVAVTVVLAIGMQRMLKRKALVRHLVAAETLGSVSVICTDKTGTLTQGRMAVVKISADHEIVEFPLANGEQLSQPLQTIVQAIILNNDAYVTSDRKHRTGDPTEVALLECGFDLHFDVANFAKKFPRTH